MNLQPCAVMDVSSRASACKHHPLLVVAAGTSRTLEFSNTYVDPSSASAMQVKSPVDASNFHAPHDDNAAGGAYRGKPYISKGDFKDF